ncbi:MAG TPA: hypothetical protein VNN62_11920 [Methylomirabilota bacterium]|nr:hypothetical protein [Methylomirabilota bacterium]
MRKKLARILLFTCAAQIFFAGVVVQGEARDLTDVFVRAFSFNALGADTTLSAKAVAPAFSAGTAEAIRQVPTTSGAPSFVYRLNQTTDIFERLTGVPGALFSERSLTLGKGQFDFSIGGSFVDFSALNGKNLTNIKSPALLNDVFSEEGIAVGQLPTGETLFAAPSSGAVIHTRIDLHAHSIVPTVRYGVTDRLEIGLSIPIVNTFLRVSNELVRVVDLDPSSARFLFARDQHGNEIPIGFVDLAGNPLDFSRAPFVKSLRPSSSLRKAAGHATGIGDIAVHAKYHLWRNGLGGAALGLNLQLPSGEVRNFHGTDEPHLSTFLYLSQVLWSRLEPRLNAGLDINVDDVDRSSFLYTIGGTVLVDKKLGFIIDFIGRSEFSRLSTRISKKGIYQGAALIGNPRTCTHERPCFINVAKGPIEFPFFPERIKRNDIVYFSFGFRYALTASGTIFFGGLAPIGNDGLRADFVPVGGIEYTF